MTHPLCLSDELVWILSVTSVEVNLSFISLCNNMQIWTCRSYSSWWWDVRILLYCLYISAGALTSQRTTVQSVSLSNVLLYLHFVNVRASTTVVFFVIAPENPVCSPLLQLCRENNVENLKSLLILSVVISIWQEEIRMIPFGLGMCLPLWKVMPIPIKKDTESTVWTTVFYYKSNRILDRNQTLSLLMNSPSYLMHIKFLWLILMVILKVPS